MNYSSKVDWVERARSVRLVLTDCDGVLTDGGVYYAANGDVMKRFSIRDGMGVERLRDLGGVETGIVTGENTPSVLYRAKKLGIVELHQNIRDKKTKLLEIVSRLSLELSEIAYIGDDVNDLEVLSLVGLSACPADAEPPVMDCVHLVLKRPGGHGVFREFGELILHAKSSVSL